MDYTTLPGFSNLGEEDKKYVKEEYERGYRSAVDFLGVKMAIGRGHETARVAIDWCQRSQVQTLQAVPPSIFEGLENCQ